MTPPRLTPLEVVAGIPIGMDGSARPLPGASRRPLAELERAVLAALVRSPCLASFSGGRDSSAVLAIAVRAARRHGLPLPVPVTLRFPDVPDADESAWQEHVVEYLRLDDWVRIDFSDELDLIGPVARGVLRHHGLLWPPNTHFHHPIIELAKGGAILTGIFGDDIFGSWRWTRIMSVLSGRVPPAPRDLARAGLAVSPPQVRRLFDRGRWKNAAPSWVQPAAMVAVTNALASDTSHEPVRWDARVRWCARRRAFSMVVESFALLARDAGVVAVHPFADPAFLASLANAGAWSGFGDRTQIMRALFSQILPEEVLSRKTKARLDAPFWHRHTREFVAAWSGHGVDEEIVDPGALRREWQKSIPHAWSSVLLQAAWMATEAIGDTGATSAPSGFA